MIKTMINRMIFMFVIFIIGITFSIENAKAQRVYLFQWDEGSDMDMPGWTWSEDIAYGHPGWLMDIDGPFGGLQTFAWGDAVRSFEKGDYGTKTRALVDISERAPLTDTGGSLRVYDTGESSIYQSCWWLWYDGQPLPGRGIADDETDRWSFYIKLHGIYGNSGTEYGAPFHVGTYLTDTVGYSTYGTGDGAPYEGPGNQHYYHYLSFSPDTWIHVELDRHPQHRRNSHVSGNDPAYLLPAVDNDGELHYMHYYSHLHQWYMEIAEEQDNPTSYLLDEMYFYSTKDEIECVEPNQNDESITSVWVGYWEATDKWQIFWHDMSFENADGENLNDYTLSTFEVRWSTSPITNTNYDQATLINPEWYTGTEITSYPNGIRRYSSWRTHTYTQFELPDDIEENNDKIYFAIKDISVEGENAGTEWPNNKGDGHDAASPYIHIIDYNLRPDSPTDVKDNTGVENIFINNFPNPFNLKTTIQYKLVAPANVKLCIFDILGNKIETLIDEFQKPNLKHIEFNAKELSGGVYFLKLSIGKETYVHRMLLL